MEEDRGPQDELWAIVGIRRAVELRDLDYVIEALKDPDFTVRKEAVFALGDLGGERANLTLLSVARDRPGERPDVRIAALDSLSRIHDAGGYASILEGFVSGDNRKVVAAARRMLSELDPEGFAGRLVARGCLDYGAISVYGRQREGTAVPLLARFLAERMGAGDISSTGYWGKVYVAVRSLGSIGGGEAVRSLESLVSWLEGAGSLVEGPLRRERLDKVEGAARASIEAARKG